MTKDELQDIIFGTKQDSQRTLIQTVACYLRANESTSSLAKNDKHFKQQETNCLIHFCNEKNLFVKDILDINVFVSEGAEQKVYIKNEKKVYKLNDAIYYTKWIDYFNNLLLHNCFFRVTEYTLVGFYLQEDILYALVEQPFIVANEPTDLENVKELMAANGFVNTKNNDYCNENLDLILEDLHDENVLTNNGVLFFIDTVFYIKS